MGLSGLEALSRGAKKVVLCDSSYKAVSIIKQNIEKTKTYDETILIKATYDRAIKDIKLKGMKFDIVFVDPPYESDFACDAANRIVDNDLLREDGTIIIETDNKEKILSNINNQLLEVYDVRKYGRVHLLFLNRKG